MRLGIFAILCVLQLTGAFSWAQLGAVEPVQNQVDMLKQEGRLVTVQLSLGEPLKIFVVGREEARLNLANMKLTVRRLQPYPAKNLIVQEAGDHFTVSEPLGSSSKLEVKTEIKGKTETFQFKVSPKKP